MICFEWSDDKTFVLLEYSITFLAYGNPSYGFLPLFCIFYSTFELIQNAKKFFFHFIQYFFTHLSFLFQMHFYCYLSTIMKKSFVKNIKFFFSLHNSLQAVYCALNGVLYNGDLLGQLASNFPFTFRRWFIGIRGNLL